MVFLNGLGETLDFWEPVVAQLEGVATFRYDRPARLPKDPGNGLAGEVDEVLRITDDLPGRLVLVGHSYGGVLAEAVARRAPERAGALVLIDATVPQEYATASREGSAEPHADADYENDQVDGRLRSWVRSVVMSDRTRPLRRYAMPKLMLGLGTATGSFRGVLAVLPRDLPRYLSSKGHLGRTAHDNLHLPGYCAELIRWRADEPFPDIPVRVVVGRLNSRLWKRTQQSWVDDQVAQLPLFGADVQINTTASAHMVMFDQPLVVAGAIESAIAAMAGQGEGRRSGDD
ncbi:MAG: hypothetical protein RLZ55_1404 [Actinomycetota bacterium]